MQITLELSSDLEMRLRESVGQGDVEAVRRLLVEVLTPTVEVLLQETSAEFTDAEFETVADQLADELTASLGPNPPSLSDYGGSRAGIYEDHP